MHHGLARILELRANNNLIVVARGCFVPAACVDHGDVAAVLLLHVFVRESELAEEFDAPDFKPHEMVGMINHAHLIGLSVANANRNFADAAFHWPLQFGLRFSRKDATPSWNSGVVRIAAFSCTAVSICLSSDFAR